jgi:polysaccharide export outer membrane protein
MNILKKVIFGTVATLLLAAPGFGDTLVKSGKVVTLFISGVPAQEKTLVDGTYPVSDSGMVSLPHIGLVRAAGLKADDLARTIERTYQSRKIYTNPTVQILTSSQDTLDKQVVHVAGKVMNPGPVEFTQGLTLYQAVAHAKGATDFGSMYRVMLFRGKKMTEYDLTKGQSRSIELMPGDTVEVPQKNIWGR